MAKRILIYLCFGILFFLSSSSGKLLGYLLIPVGFAVGMGLLFLLKIILKLFNGKIVQKSGNLPIETSVYDGFILIFPFVIFAFLAVKLFGPGSGLPFMSAGLTICGGLTGMELMKKGGGKFSGMIIPSLFSMASSSLLSFLITLIKQGGIF